jgi:UDP-glucose:(heptosyl)LPS alpha-1,3-glucosyltransferase
MRIGLVVERFEPAGGGIEHAVWKIAHALAAAGDEVVVFARRSAESSVVQVERLTAPRFWQPLRVGVFARRVGQALRAARREQRLDTVHTFCRAPGGDCFHAGGGSHAHYMRRTYGARGASWRRLSPRHATQLALEERVFAEPAPWVQCVSSMVARELSQRFDLPAARMRIVPYGVDTRRFRPAEPKERQRLRAALGASDAPAWLFAGSGWRRKGLDTALTALARCRDDRTQLWVAGRDPELPWRKRVETLGLAGRVKFLGLRSDLEAVLPASDGLLLPTRYDAFGLVCLEAAAARVPIITSSAAGAAELLQGAARVVEDPEDASAFASAMDELSDRVEADRLGGRGRQIAEANTWDVQTERLRDLYAEIRAERLAS